MDWGGTLSEYWSADVYLREELVFLEENYDNHNEDTANESYTKLNLVVSQKEHPWAVHLMGSPPTREVGTLL